MNTLGNELWHTKPTAVQSQPSEIITQLPNGIRVVLLLFSCVCVCVCLFLSLQYKYLRSVLDFEPAESWKVHLIRARISFCLFFKLPLLLASA